MVSLAEVASVLEALYAVCPNNWTLAFESSPQLPQVKKVQIDGSYNEVQVGIERGVQTASWSHSRIDVETKLSTASRSNSGDSALGIVGRFLVLCAGRLPVEKLVASEVWSPTKSKQHRRQSQLAPIGLIG